MRFFFTFLFAICLASQIWAQGTSLKWVRNAGSLGVDYGRAVAVDLFGFVYSTGHFMGTIDFDPGPNVFNLTSAGSSDVYILKLDPNGNFIWAKRIGGTGTDISYAIALDNSGSIYYTGNFEATVDFDPGPAVYNLSATTTNAPPGFI